MKVIEGTPEEINEYMNKNTKGYSNPYMVKKSGARMPFKFKDEIHWSTTKQEWVQIHDMDSSHIVNSMKKMMKEKTVKDLLGNDEFKAFIVNLSYRIEDEEV